MWQRHIHGAGERGGGGYSKSNSLEAVASLLGVGDDQHGDADSETTGRETGETGGKSGEEGDGLVAGDTDSGSGSLSPSV
jgi:hypothetical protein